MIGLTDRRRRSVSKIEEEILSARNQMVHSALVPVLAMAASGCLADMTSVSVCRVHMFPAHICLYARTCSSAR